MTRSLVAVAIATALWIPALTWLERSDAAPVLEPRGLTPLAQQLLARQLAALDDAALGSADVDRLRGANPEWELMGKSYFAWALANAALREPERKAELLAAMDEVIARTEAEERAHGFRHFLFPYARHRPFLGQPEASLFVDGEVALMYGMRRLAEEKPEYRAPMAARVARIERAMGSAPLLSAESYPDQCWLFDNANALAALKLSDALDGGDHRALIDGWLAHAKETLVEPHTGLLVSSYTLQGAAEDGPEGSTLWMSIHALSLVDPAFAREQYRRAVQWLRVDVAGFALAREWPRGHAGRTDIDSGLTLPLLGASPSSSGLALVAAADQKDAGFLAGLLASLRYAGFPTEDAHGLSFAAGNPMGDAVLLYALTEGPVWDAARARR